MNDEPGEYEVEIIGPGAFGWSTFWQGQADSSGDAARKALAARAAGEIFTRERAD